MTSVLGLDLGSKSGWAVRRHNGLITTGTCEFKNSRYDGGGMRFVRFRSWLHEICLAEGVSQIFFEEVRRHKGVDAAHVYGGFLAHLTGFCEERGIAYSGLPVGEIKKFATGNGRAAKEAMIASAQQAGINPADDNEADAYFVLALGCQQIGCGFMARAA